MISKTVLRNPWVQAGAVVVGLALVLILLWLLKPVLVPLFFAFLVAYVLDPLVDRFEARGISRTKTIGLMAALAVVLLLSVPFVVVPSIFSQAETLARANTSRLEVVSEEQGRFAKWGDSLLDMLPLTYLLDVIPDTDGLEAVSEVPGHTEAGDGGAAVPDATAGKDGGASTGPVAGGSEIVEPARSPYEGMTRQELRTELAERIGIYVKLNARNLLQSYAPSMAVAGQRAGVTVAHLVSSLGQWTLGAIVFLANLALFAFVAGFLLKDFDKLVANARTLIPYRYRPKVEEIALKIHDQITSFLRGQLTVCLCLGVMYIVGLTASGVPFSIPIGIFGGIAAFIPYIGITLTIIPSVILTLLAHGLSWHIVGVLVTFSVAQFLEGTFLTPKIVGDKVGLNPVWVILAILVFGNAFGFLGILLAVPMAASLKVLVLEAVAYYKASRAFTDSGDSGTSS